MNFTSLSIFFVTQGDDALDPGQGLCPWTPSGALYTIGGPGSHSWVLALRAQCFSLKAIPKSWKPWLLRGHYLFRRPFSLQWPNIYNSCGKGIRAGEIGGIDMIILAIFYRKRKMERLE